MNASDSDPTFDPFAGPAIALSVPTTEPQREVWTATQVGRDASLAFNEAVTLRLRGAVDVPALRTAIDDLFARHEALRATFSPDGLTMLVSEAQPVDVPVLDLRTFGATEGPVLRQTLLRQVVTEPFDLSAGPLARCVLVQHGDADMELVLSAHHIICDGWSFGVIASELAALYTARTRGTVASLPAPERFSDYARASAAASMEPARADDERYWLSRFSGALPVLDLPSDRPRSARRTYTSAREDRVIPADVARTIRAAGARAGSSMFVTLLSGFATLVHRLSGQDDLVIGVPSAGQAATGAHGLVGHCVNMLPLRITTDRRAPFSALLQQVRMTSLDAFEHQGLSFGSLLTRLPIARDPGRSPLVSVIFNVDRPLPPSSMPFAGLRAELQTVPRAYENFDLFLNAVEGDGGILLECQYNSALYDGATVRRWLESYELLLRGAAGAEQATLGELPILTGADAAALRSCNDTALPLPSVPLVHRIIEGQVVIAPDAIAVLQDGVTLTYAELDARANRLARHLRAQGVTRGMLVGLCLDRTPELLVGLLAILKSGAGYVPLDPHYPADRLAYMASDADLAALVTDARTADALGLPARTITCIDRDAAAIAAQDGSPLPVDAHDAQPEDTAYVIYTSGSTGRPKGVLVPHRAVVNLLASVQRTPGLTSRDTVLAITTLSFDIAVSEVILPLTVGARIVLACRDVATDGMALMQLIESTGVTFIDATPATYRLLLAAGWQGSSALRLICTGEAMPRDLAQVLTGCAAEVWNGYGPTETTVWSTFARVQAPVERVLIGRPVANTRISVLDELGQQVPIGVPGELFIGGEGVSNGYRNRPDLTAERFLPDPFLPGRTQYRTGDLVRLLPSGELECLGRNDNQVKVRGYRIEPGEIEVVLGRHPGVKAAVVVAREDRVGDVRLVAYLVTESEDVISDDLRTFARQSLPEFMVPASYVRLPALPLTPSGKVDRKALPAPQAAPAVTVEAAFVAPRTPSETIVAALWAEVLGLARVSVHDDFFALGGHSLLASQVLARLRRDHGVTLSFRMVFEAPTVAALAALVDGAREAAAPSAAAEPAGIPHREGAQDAPLSVLQERLWMLEELDPSQRSAHAHSASWMLRGALDLARLERALQALVLRHASLRTSFHVIDGERRQVTTAASQLVMGRVDLSALDATTQQAALVDFFREQQFTPFDLAHAPLFRAIVVTLGPDAHLLYTLQHGMVWDGWSFDLFLHDLVEFYAADAQGRAPTLEPLPVTYGDFAAWQSGWLAGTEAAQQVSWWRAQLSGDLRELALATDRPRPEVSALAGAQVTLAFTPDEAELLRAFARQHDATLFMVLFAAYNVLLHRHTGLEDLLVGSPVRARTRPELEHLVGPFVNTVLLRTRLQPSQRFTELLASIRNTTLDSFSHQELPFERLGTRVPPVRVLFSMQDARERPTQMGDVQVEQHHVPQHFAMNDMMLWMMESRQQLIAVLNYSTELFEQGSAEVFLAQLRALLLAVVAQPDCAIASYDLATAADRGCDAPTSVSEAGLAPMAGALRAAVDAHGQRVAVRDGRARLTYAQLAMRVAHVRAQLDAYGAAAGVPVAIALPHGADRVVAIAAVVEAGLPVLLLDPADAPAWQERAIRAAGATLVVASDEAPVFEDIALLPAAALRGEAAMRVAPYVPVPGDVAQLVAVPSADGGVTAVRVAESMVRRQVHALAARLGVGSEAVVLPLHTAATPIGVLEVLLPLVRGATLDIASEDARDDARDLADAIEDGGATHVLAPEGAWRALLGTTWRGGSIMGVVTGSGVPSVETLTALAARVARVSALRGDATTLGAATLHTASAEDTVSLAGHSLTGTPVMVIDASGAVQPTCVPGTLCVGPAAAGPAIRARRMADGRVHLVGEDPAWLCVDGQAAPGEAVASTLRSIVSVSDAAAVMHRDGAGVPRVVAYVVAAPGQHHTDSALRAAVRSRLPGFIVPQRLVELAVIPRTMDGGVEHGALPSPFAAAASAFVAPRTPIEQALVAACRDVLGVERISLTDNFFRLGGTSLLCFRVVEQVRNATGGSLNPRALLVGTLEQAAADLERQAAQSAAPRAPAEAGGVLSRLRSVMSGTVS